MKKFEIPILEVEKLDVVNVITTSCPSDDSSPNCPDDMGLV